MYKPPRLERLITEYMTIVGHIGDEVGLLKDGAPFAMFELDGIPPDTTDLSELDWLSQQLNLTYRGVATMRPEITIYDCRGTACADVYPWTRSRAPLAERIERSYRDNLLNDSLYSNKLFMSVHIPTQYMAGDWVGTRVTRWRSGSVRSGNRAMDRVATLEALCGQLFAELKPYRPRRLRVVRRGRVPCSEIAEAIAYAFTGVWRQVPLVVGSLNAEAGHGRLGRVIITEQIVIGPEAIEMRGPGYSVFAACFSLREYPAESWPGMFAPLATGAYRRTIVHTFTILLGADAMALISRKQNRMVNAEDKAYSQVAGLTVLANRLQNNELVMGLHSMTVIAFADSLPALNATCNAVATDMASCGAVVIRERRALEATLFSILQGNGWLRVRPGTISSINFAAMAPLHGYPSGPRSGRWGAPIAVFRSLAGTPLYFHWSVGKYGNGNTLLTGESGSGKTVVGAFLTAMSSKVAGILALDHKRGWETLFRGMGAPYAILGGGKPFLAPLKALEPTNRNLEFLTDLIRSCVLQGGDFVFDDEESRRLFMGIRSVMQLQPQDRWLTDVRAFLGSKPGGAGARLQKWCHGEELGWVLDSPEDIVCLDRDINAFDITQLMKNPRARGPAIVYIMHRIASRLDGRPFLVPIDEGWLVADDPVFAPLVFAQARTIRSRNGVLVFITQSPADAAKPGIAEALVEQFPNQIHMANPRAQKHHYVDGLKRTQREYEIIRRLPTDKGQFLLAQGNRTVVGQLLLDGLEDVQMVLSTPEELLHIVDDVRADVGDDPDRLIFEYHRRRRELVPQ